MGKNKDYSTCLQGAEYFPHCHGNPFRYLGIDWGLNIVSNKREYMCNFDSDLEKLQSVARLWG